MGFKVYKFDEIRRLTKTEVKEQMAFVLNEKNVELVSNLTDKSGSIRDMFQYFLTIPYEVFLTEQREKIFNDFEDGEKRRVNILIEPSLKDKLQNIRDEFDIPLYVLLNSIISFEDNY